MFYLEKSDHLNLRGLGVNQEEKFISNLINRSERKIKTYRREIRNEYRQFENDDPELEVKYFNTNNLKVLFNIFKETEYSEANRDIKEKLGKV